MHVCACASNLRISVREVTITWYTRTYVHCAVYMWSRSARTHRENEEELHKDSSKGENAGQE